MRKAGVLLHISSLPGPFGCGTFGREAYTFADFLHAAGFRIWQVLPFNVPHRDASPYSSVSTFAQNPLFIDPATLCEEGLLTRAELETLTREAPANEKDFYALSLHREPFLRAAAARADAALRGNVSDFLAQNPNVERACTYLCKDAPTEENFFYYAFLQYQFYKQWQALHAYLGAHGIEVIGDIPIYADLHSSEVYFHPECFLLDADKKPPFVSGVPGDSFNEDGQKWGHPLYRTEALAAQNYRLLFDRMAFAAKFYDVTRIDHFQAIAAFYAIPADGHPREGHWETGVGDPFVKRLVNEIGAERFIVEDFDCFPGGSHALADRYGLPDMNTLQFSMNKGESVANYREATVAYTGTHDNDTLIGYLCKMSQKKRARIAVLLHLPPDSTAKEIARAGMEALCASRAARVVIPAQDLLFEGGESRMNVPGISGQGNWHWRITHEKLEKLEKLAPLWHQTLKKYDRLEDLV